MKRLWIVAGLMLLVLHMGCEQEITDPDWPPYEEKLVIAASLEVADDSLLLLCRVTRTLPLNVEYTEAAALLNDASVTLLCGGVEYSADAKPYPRYGPPYQNFSAIVPRHGARAVQLRVRHGGKTAISTLQLPDPPPFDTLGVTVSQWGDTLVFSRIYPMDDLATYQFLLYQTRIAFRNPASRSNLFVMAPDDGTTAAYSSESVSGFNGNAYCRVRMTSPEYEQYDRLRWNWGGSGDPFDNSSGKNPPFNVTGDGIGFFWSVITGPATEIRWR
ncbi:MAG: DUF4249 family protein [Ignavibacteria bacterium]|nr:DUF4249 family protein [Ignavibacteria bacterium]